MAFEGWDMHEYDEKQLPFWLEDYQYTLNREGLMAAWKRLAYYNSEDYDINDCGFLIWDTAIWMISLQWLLSQRNESIDYQKLFNSFTDDNPEKIYYLRTHHDDIEGWEQHLRSTIDIFIYEE